MERDYVEAKLLDFIDHALLDGQGSDLTPSTALFALGLVDSFGLFRIIGFISDEFKISVKLDSLKSEDFESVSAIAALVCSRVSSEGSTVESGG